MPPVFKQVKSVLAADKAVAFGYLFGSQVTGKTTKRSDVDVAIYLNLKKEEDRFQKRLDFYSKIEVATKKQADVVILNDLNSVFFKFVIISEGKLVFERGSAERADFELKTMNEYYDFKPFLKEYGDALIKRLALQI